MPRRNAERRSGHWTNKAMSTAGHNNSPCQKSTIHNFIVNKNGIHLQGKKDGEPDDKENQTQRGRGEGALLSDGECQFHQQDQGDRFRICSCFYLGMISIHS